MKKKIFILSILIFSALVFAFDWPVKNVIITSTFGESRNDHFHSGVDIGGGAQEVYPIAPGEIIFQYDEARDYTSIPYGLGSHVVLHHDEKLRSIYCHLLNGSINRDKKSVISNEMLGIIGDTGYSLGKHLHLTLIDCVTNKILNPLPYLPAVKDKNTPILKKIYLKKGVSLIELKDDIELTPSPVQVIVETYDQRGGVNYYYPMAPYQIFLSYNGEEVITITFDAIFEEDGNFLINGCAKNFNEIYANNPDIGHCYFLANIELVTGENRILIAVKDIAGNEKIKEIIFSVQEK